MSAPPADEVGGGFTPRVLGRVSITRSVHAVGMFVSDDHKTFARGVIALDARVIVIAELVVRGVEEPLEHYKVRYTREVPLGVAMRGRGR
jgi:hypothetical protein